MYSCLRNLLKDSWGLISTTEAGSPMQTAAFGKLCCRALLHLLGKEKQHREPGGFENLGKIAELFTKDLSSKAAPSASVEAAGDTGMKVTDCFQARPAELALLQNVHMKIGERPMVLSDMMSRSAI